MHGLALVSFNTWLIIANSVIFVVGQFGPRTIDPWIKQFGHFSTFEAVQKWEFWRLITFQFLHADIMHLVFNMLGLYMFGELAERYLGFKKYAAFYLVCGIFGGVMYLTLNLLGSAAAYMGVMGVPGLLYPYDTSSLYSHAQLIGASAGVFGVIMAAAYIAPTATVSLVFPPIPMRMKTFAYGYVGLAVFMVLIGSRNAGGEAAHIGGALAGYFFIRRPHLLTDFFDVFTDSRKPPRKAARGVRGGGGGGGRLAGMPAPAEVDRILQKVREEGLGSLTEREKDMLRRATEAERSA